MTSITKSGKRSENPVWFITGCSTGFGRQIATHVLNLGYRAVVTSRNPEEVRDLGELGDALVLKLNVTDRSQAEEAVNAAEDHYGSIDVLVNNAGIGYFAAVEESDEEEVRKMFGVNVFGLSRNDAYDGAIAKLDELRQEFTAWEAVSRGADFPEATPTLLA